MNYYNEFDPYAAEWLQNLIDAGVIPPGYVDTRSIKDVRAADLVGYTQHHFFAGVGGFPVALRLAAWADDAPIVTGSCPCQPFSGAGKRKGVDDERHLWPVFRDLLAELRPPVAIGEQVASKDGREWLAGVRADLEALGYEVGAADLCAAGAGAPHIRQRLFWGCVRLEFSNSHGRSGKRPEIRREGEAAGSGEDSNSSDRLGNSDIDGMGRKCGDAPGAQEKSHCQRKLHGTCGLEPAVSGRACRLADTGRTDVQQQLRSCQASRANGAAEAKAQQQQWRWPDTGSGGGDFCRLGESNLPGLPLSEQGELRGSRRIEEGRATQQSGGAWSEAIQLACTDGKSRRIEPGSFPLAYGIPAATRPIVARLVELGHSPGVAKRLVRDAKRNRPGRLKAYGNAIVPAVAAEFIQAFTEAHEDIYAN